MVRAETPTLQEIKDKLSIDEVRALMTLAICEICDFFNVGKSMDDYQVAVTVDLLIEEFGHLRPEEIKYCFRLAMKKAKVYDRIDGNIILGWLEDYERIRSEELLSLYEEQDKEGISTTKSQNDGIPFDNYVSLLQERAINGDSEAHARLNEVADLQQYIKSNRQDNAKKELAFKKYYFSKYLNQRNKEDDNRTQHQALR